MSPLIDRARGALMGQVAGDALGSQVELESPSQIRRGFPEGVRLIFGGGLFDLMPGQPGDDSEMALLLARSIVASGGFDAEDVEEHYHKWLESKPFDCSYAISAALEGNMQMDSLTDGALARVSPIGIFGARHKPEQVADWAMADASLTHPSPICCQVNALYAMAIATAIREQPDPKHLYKAVIQWAEERDVAVPIKKIIVQAGDQAPLDFTEQVGQVLPTFQNALYQMLHAPNVEEGIVETINQGGDTDTNAAVAGALLGAVHGLDNIPEAWRDAVLACRPENGAEGVGCPRPECFWPVDILDLAEKLVSREVAVGS